MKGWKMVPDGFRFVDEEYVVKVVSGHPLFFEDVP